MTDNQSPTVRVEQAEDALILKMLYELHANVPEDQRPMGMCDLSDDQAIRARNAVRVVRQSGIDAGLAMGAEIARAQYAGHRMLGTTRAANYVHAGNQIATALLAARTERGEDNPNGR